ncbi:MAG TPA: RluA family pseudouridine synthase [Acidobacteriaceae bacterium]|jgi:23S rRNA pseudouridine1911/1915/1917 synthase|nr:RluA family pseudouridine synthase [Acidobacteriaceae bacterium]
MAITYTVPPEAAKQRLDAWLAGQLAGVSRERVQLLIEQEKVRLDGKSPRASYRLRGGEAVEVLGDPVRPPLRAFAEDIPLTIVYEDAELSVIDKPAGMTVHAGAGAVEGEGGTLVNALLHRYQSLSSVGGDQRPGIVHRLDKQTSGLIVVARNDAAHARLAAMFAERKMKKTYLALVHGHLKQDRGTIDAPIARDLLRRTRMTTRRQSGARTAVSHYTVLRRVSSRFGKYTLVSVRIETGRTHQIRVHLASIGHPVVGDTIYGAPARLIVSPSRQTRDPEPESLQLKRNFLHAAELEFAHPRTGKPVHLKSALPRELDALLRAIESGQVGE